MAKRTRKGKYLLLAVKLALSVALLAWVLSKVHYRDYVVHADTGKAYPVLRAERGETGDAAVARFVVRRGYLWWARSETLAAEDLLAVSDRPGPGRYLHTGFASSLRQLSAWAILAGLAGFLVTLLLVGVRLWRLLAAQEIRIAPWEVIRLTFLGQLFNQIVPGTVGGDLVKAWYVARHTPHKGKVLMTLFVDRLVGLTEMTLLSLVMILVLVGGGADLGPLRTPMLSVAVVLALATGAFVALFWPGLRRALRLDRLVRRLPFAEQIASAERGAGQFGRRPGVLVEGLGLSLAAHVCWIAGLAAIGVGLGLPAAWYSYFLYIPLIYIIGSVPLTPGGVGLIEHFFLVFFVASGATASQVLALALLARLIPLFWALPGLAVVVTGTRVPPAETIEAELGVAGPAESK